MQRQIICLGGIHGVGKSSLCARLEVLYGWPVVKQRRILTCLADHDGVEWEEVRKEIDAYLHRAASYINDLFSAREVNVVLLDCHYAIPADAADRKYSEALRFVPNLDWELVRVLREMCTCRFIHLAIRPEVALTRLSSRPEAEHYRNTIEHFIAESSAEKRLFQELLRHFRVSCRDYMVISDEDAQTVLEKVVTFVDLDQRTTSSDHL